MKRKTAFLLLGANSLWDFYTFGAFVPDYLFKDSCIANSLGDQGQIRNSFSDQDNKDSTSFQGKYSLGLLAAFLKDWKFFLNLKFFIVVPIINLLLHKIFLGCSVEKISMWIEEQGKGISKRNGMLLAVWWVINSVVFDPEDSCLLPVSMNCVELTC